MADRIFAVLLFNGLNHSVATLLTKIDIKGRHLILVEDIVDTGNTLHYLVDKLRVREPASITVCTLLLKPKAIEVSIEELKYVGFEIENEFVVGYGLDYREQGRGLMGIYKRVG